MVEIKKETANIWEYKVDNIAIIANFVCSWVVTLNSFVHNNHWVCSMVSSSFVKLFA